MEDTNESTEAKLKEVTSPIKRSRQALNAKQNTNAGVKPPTDQKAVTSEKMRDLLARMKDITHTWPIRGMNGTMPAAFISNKFIYFAFPVDGHVVRNAVTSEGAQNFEVDGVLVIPVTSEGK